MNLNNSQSDNARQTSYPFRSNMLSLTLINIDLVMFFLYCLPSCVVAL